MVVQWTYVNYKKLKHLYQLSYYEITLGKPPKNLPNDLKRKNTELKFNAYHKYSDINYGSLGQKIKEFMKMKIIVVRMWGSFCFLYSKSHLV